MTPNNIKFQRIVSYTCVYLTSCVGGIYVDPCVPYLLIWWWTGKHVVKPRLSVLNVHVGDIDLVMSMLSVLNEAKSCGILLLPLRL